MNLILEEDEYNIFMADKQNISRDTIITNIKIYDRTPLDKDKEYITHIKYFSFTRFIHFEWATNLKFLMLDFGFQMNKIKLNNFENLHTLVISPNLIGHDRTSIERVSNIELLNLPHNLKTLIILRDRRPPNSPFYMIKNLKLDFMKKLETLSLPSEIALNLITFPANLKVFLIDIQGSKQDFEKINVIDLPIFLEKLIIKVRPVHYSEILKEKISKIKMPFGCELSIVHDE